MGISINRVERWIVYLYVVTLSLGIIYDIIYDLDHTITSLSGMIFDWGPVIVLSVLCVVGIVYLEKRQKFGYQIGVVTALIVLIGGIYQVSQNMVLEGMTSIIYSIPAIIAGAHLLYSGFPEEDDRAASSS